MADFLLFKFKNMATYEDVQKSAGRLGKIIDTVGNFLGNPLPDWNISESLESWGGNLGSKFVLVPKANAVDQPNYEMGPQPFIGPPQNKDVVTNKQVTNTGGNTGNSQQDIINAYKAMGWTDVNAILDDYAATGGSKIGGGSGGGEDLNARLRSEIESGYDTYINDLNNLYGGLTTQAGAQENIAQNSYEQSIKDLLANKQSSLQDLGLTEQKLQANQVKNLRDIASNIQNQYMAGNVMLGARGAGDSSAANQYSYALNRLGSKERGNVMNTTAQSQQEIENQKAKLNNIVTQETSRLDTELANVKQGIASWLAEQQNAVSQMISQGKLNKSKEIASLTQNLLNQALSAYQTKQQEIADKRARLETWAMNNAKKISELAPIMQGIGQFAPNMAQARTLNGNVSMDAQGNIRGLYAYGNSDEDENNYFG